MAQADFISYSGIGVMESKPLKNKIENMHFLIIMSHTNARFRSEENSSVAGGARTASMLHKYPPLAFCTSDNKSTPLGTVKLTRHNHPFYMALFANIIKKDCEK